MAFGLLNWGAGCGHAAGLHEPVCLVCAAADAERTAARDGAASLPEFTQNDLAGAVAQVRAVYAR